MVWLLTRGISVQNDSISEYCEVAWVAGGYIVAGGCILVQVILEIDTIGLGIGAAHTNACKDHVLSVSADCGLICC